jgi:hypothetical protein
MKRRNISEVIYRIKPEIAYIDWTDLSSVLSRYLQVPVAECEWKQRINRIVLNKES